MVKDLRSRKVLRMVVNAGARASVSADTFFARGAAAVTLIEALERAAWVLAQLKEEGIVMRAA